MAAPQLSRSTTVTLLQPPAPEPIVLRLHLRPPQSGVNESTQAVVQPCLGAAAAGASATQQKIPKAKVIALIKATFNLLEIQKCFERQVLNWQDPLSGEIFTWVNDFNEFVEKAVLPSRKATAEVLNEVLNGLECRVNKLFNEILRDLMYPKVLDNPLIEEDRYVWGEALLKKCQALTPESPYTQKPFNAKPHLPARAILEWGKEFFPTHFTQPNTSTADGLEGTPLDERTFKIIKKNAKVIVKLHIARQERKEAERIKQAAEAFARETHQSNLQMLLQRSIRIENELQAQSDARCERLNQRIVQLTEFFETEIANLRSELANTRADHNEILAKLVRLEVYASALKSRNEALATEIGMLKQSLACAHQRINGDGGGGCNLM